MPLIVWLPAEALLADRKEAAVLDRGRAEVTDQQDRVHQHNRHVSLSQVILDLLNSYRTGRDESTRELGMVTFNSFLYVKEAATVRTLNHDTGNMLFNGLSSLLSVEWVRT